MTNIVALNKPPTGLSDVLRKMADDADAGRLTDLVSCVVNDGNYEFTYGASLSGAVVMSSLLQQNCIDRMRA